MGGCREGRSEGRASGRPCCIRGREGPSAHRGRIMEIGRSPFYLFDLWKTPPIAILRKANTSRRQDSQAQSGNTPRHNQQCDQSISTRFKKEKNQRRVSLAKGVVGGGGRASVVVAWTTVSLEVFRSHCSSSNPVSASHPSQPWQIRGTCGGAQTASSTACGMMPTPVILQHIRVPDAAAKDEDRVPVQVAAAAPVGKVKYNRLPVKGKEGAEDAVAARARPRASKRARRRNMPGSMRSACPSMASMTTPRSCRPVKATRGWHSGRSKPPNKRPAGFRRSVDQMSQTNVMRLERSRYMPRLPQRLKKLPQHQLPHHQLPQHGIPVLLHPLRYHTMPGLLH